MLEPGDVDGDSDAVVLKRTLRQYNTGEIHGDLFGVREIASSPNLRTNSMRAES